MTLQRPTLAGPSPGESAVEVRELTKRYEPAGVDALQGVSFQVAGGEIFGLLGRNGAGKSTTVRILTTLMRPTSGTAFVHGMDVTAQPAAVRRILGVALQDAALDELMTGREHLVLAGRLAGTKPKAAAARAGELLDAFGLAGAADRIAARYSGGMRRRLDVAMALVRKPQVLFLDEPTTGLDPQSRRALWELIRRERQLGATVVLTTQYMAEADDLSDRVAVVHAGRIIAIGSPDELKARFGTTTIRLRAPESETHAEATVRGLEGIGAVDVTGGGWLTATVGGGEVAVPAVVARLSACRLAIDRMAVVPPTLEDVFVALTGSEIEATSGSGDHGSISAVRRGMGVSAGSGR